MDITTSTSNQRLRTKSELDKFRLFYEFATPHKEIKQNLKQRLLRRSRSES